MKKLVSALLLSAAISAPALAAEQGGFIAADIGPATFTGTDFATVNGNVAFPNPGSFSFSGGYHFNQNVGIEGGLVAVGDSTVNSPGATETLKTSALYVTAVGMVPVSPQFDLYGKLGLASLKVDYTASAFGFSSANSASNTNLMFGLGGQFNFNPHWGLRVQYENFGTATFPANFFPGRTIAVGLSTFTVGGILTF